jgi:hypothetical protein
VFVRGYTYLLFSKFLLPCVLIKFPPKYLDWYMKCYLKDPKVCKKNTHTHSPNCHCPLQRNPLEGVHNDPNFWPQLEAVLEVHVCHHLSAYSLIKPESLQCHIFTPSTWLSLWRRGSSYRGLNQTVVEFIAKLRFAVWSIILPLPLSFMLILFWTL